MVQQIACMLSPITGNGSSASSIRPLFHDIIITGESWSCAINTVDFVGSLLPDDNTESGVFDNIAVFFRELNDAFLGLGIVYVRADSARLDLADAAANYHVFWRWTINRSEKPVNDTEKSPFKNPSSAELIALRDYLALQSGKSTTTITTWLANLFDVTPANAVSWATSRARYHTITKLAFAFQVWSKSVSDLNNIGV